MSGRHSRRKGADFEREIARRFRKVMPGADIRRGIQFRSGAEAPDVEMPCFWPELKHRNKTNIRGALRQATEACPPGKWPIAVCKDNYAAPTVTLLFEDFLEIVEQWWAAQER